MSLTLKAFKIEDYEEANKFIVEKAVENQSLMVDSGYIIIRYDNDPYNTGENDQKKILVKELKEEKGKLLAYVKNEKVAARKIEKLAPKGYKEGLDYKSTKDLFKELGFKPADASAATDTIGKIENELIMARASIGASNKNIEILEEMIAEIK